MQAFEPLNFQIKSTYASVGHTVPNEVSNLCPGLWPPTPDGHGQCQDSPAIWAPLACSVAKSKTDCATEYWRPRLTQVVAVLPADPCEQLNLAHRITCRAYSQRVASLEDEAGRLRRTLEDRAGHARTLETRLATCQLELQQALDKVRARAAADDDAPHHQPVCQCQALRHWALTPAEHLCQPRSSACSMQRSLARGTGTAQGHSGKRPETSFSDVLLYASGQLACLCPDSKHIALPVLVQAQQHDEARARADAERASLSETVRRLSREVAKLEAFKRNLLHSLQAADEVRGTILARQEPFRLLGTSAVLTRM